MDETRNRHKSNTSVWLVIGVIVLIILLMIWLTIADLFGDTDVSASLINNVASSPLTMLQC